MKRRDVLKAGVLSGAAAAFARGAEGSQTDTPKNLTLVFAGLCAYMPLTENGASVARALLMNPHFESSLELPDHDPVVVFRTASAPENPAHRVPALTEAWIREAYKGDVAEGDFLECRRLTGTHVMIKGLAGAAIEFNDAVELARLKDVVPSPKVRSDVLTAEVNGRPIVLGSFLFPQGKVKDGKTANSKARMAKFDFRPGSHKQKISESLEFKTDKTDSRFVLKGVGSKPFEVELTPIGGNKPDAWILNMSIHKHDVGKKSLFHFAAYYDVLVDRIPPIRRPIPHTDDDVVVPQATASAPQSSQRPQPDAARFLGDVYCPGGGP